MESEKGHLFRGGNGICKQTGVKAYVQVVVVDDIVVLKGEIGYVKRKNRCGKGKGKLRVEGDIYIAIGMYKEHVQVMEEKLDEVTVLKT